MEAVNKAIAADTSDEVKENALLAKSYAIGESEIRDGEETDNSKYYSQLSKSYAIGNTGLEGRENEDTDNAEYLVRDLFASKTTKYRFERVAEDKKYYYKGDIRAIALDGHETFIEVKDDSRICDTHNVLCEESVYYNV